ncbi:MAG: D-alanine--D-alanine ligase [Sphaerochaetaceae bacterium]|jgi:D-alanine-D-alanine ligase|nr:D-alanine--D-alanine ligase [Sphaerochaetaceae bacterium]
MDSTRDIIILYNNVSQEGTEDVLDSIHQAQWIAEILTDKGYNVGLRPFSFSAIDTFATMAVTERPIIFNLVDSAPEEEYLAYLIPGILHHAHLRHTGCSLEALHATTDKVMTKHMLLNHGIATAQWISSGRLHGEIDWNDKVSFILKPTSDDASVGVSDNSLLTVSALTEALEAIGKREQETAVRWFAERFIEGREFTVCMYEKEGCVSVMDPYEWVFEGYEERHLPKIITYDAKWNESSYGFEHIIARYDFPDEETELLESIRAIAKRCWALFGLSGYARVDVRVDTWQKPWVLEINGNPSFYGFYHSAKKANIEFESIVLDILSSSHY